MIVLLLGALVGWASDPSPVAEPQDPPTVRREIARGVWVDWTDLAIEVTTRARGHGPQDAEAAEQQARREVDAAIRQAYLQRNDLCYVQHNFAHHVRILANPP
jgi:hypothetical protein